MDFGLQQSHLHQRKFEVHTGGVGRGRRDDHRVELPGRGPAVEARAPGAGRGVRGPRYFGQPVREPVGGGRGRLPHGDALFARVARDGGHGHGSCAHGARPRPGRLPRVPAARHRPVLPGRRPGPVHRRPTGPPPGHGRAQGAHRGKRPHDRPGPGPRHVFPRGRPLCALVPIRLAVQKTSCDSCHAAVVYRRVADQGTDDRRAHGSGEILAPPRTAAVDVFYRESR